MGLLYPQTQHPSELQPKTIYCNITTNRPPFNILIPGNLIGETDWTTLCTLIWNAGKSLNGQMIFYREAPESLKTAVLFLIFNRPGSTASVFEAIRKVRPTRLYVAGDGPRDGVVGDAKRVAEARRIAMEVDWPCKVRTLFRSKNLGCKYAVNDAILWFFRNEPYGIILEDDVLPTTEFFFAIERCLKKYKDHYYISSVSGRNELSNVEDFRDRPVLSNKFWCWGWGSWRNRVLSIDVEYGYDKRIKLSGLYNGFFDYCYIREMAHLLSSGSVHTWDWPYDLCFRYKQQKSLILPINQVRNIGFGSGGTHATQRKEDEISVVRWSRPMILPENPILHRDFVRKFVYLNKLKKSKLRFFFFIVGNSSIFGRALVILVRKLWTEMRSLWQ